MSKVRKTIIKNWIIYYLCSKCNKFKIEECFSKWKKYKTWLRSSCKECDKKDSRKYHETHREKEREYNRNYRKTHKDICNAQLYRYPYKRKARISVINYIKYNNIIRPEKCPICWEIWKIETHHIDYTKWNIIVWCCKKCHALIHRWEIDVSNKEIDITNKENDILYNKIRRKQVNI